MKDCIQKGNIYIHNSGVFRLRERKGRAYEYELTSAPSLWQSTGKRDPDEAIDFVLATLSDSPFMRKTKRITLRNFADNFYMRTDRLSKRKRDISFGKQRPEVYYTDRQARLDNHILPKFGSMVISEITDFMIEDWYVNVKNIQTKEPLSPASKIKILEAFSEVMREAKRQQIINVNPCDTVERVAMRTMRRRGVFSDDDIKKMFPWDMEKLKAIWGNYTNALYFSIMCDTGFRPGEVAGIAHSNIHGNGVFVTGSVDLRTRQYKNRIKTTGIGREFRTGKLSDYTVSLIQKKEEETKSEDGFLFKENGRFINVGGMNVVLRKAFEYLGIKDDGSRPQYSFRHSFITYIMNKAGDISEDDALMLFGHTQYEGTYDHRTPEDVMNKIDPVTKLINERRK